MELQKAYEMVMADIRGYDADDSCLQSLQAGLDATPDDVGEIMAVTQIKAFVMSIEFAQTIQNDIMRTSFVPADPELETTIRILKSFVDTNSDICE